jgi:hypothetical protein
MAVFADIRAGLAAKLDATYGTGAAAADQVQVSAYMLESPLGPTLMVKGPDDVEYNEAFGRGLGYWRIVIQGFAGTAITTAAQTLLDTWISPDGVKAVLEAGDRTLGGKVQDLTVENARHYGLFHLPSGMSFLGVEWVVLVLVPGAS